MKEEVNMCNPMLLEYNSSIRGVLAYLLGRVCPEKSMIPIGHGDASSFKCFRTPINVEDAVIDSTRSCKYNGYAPLYGLLETRRYFSPFYFNPPAFVASFAVGFFTDTHMDISYKHITVPLIINLNRSRVWSLDYYYCAP